MATPTRQTSTSRRTSAAPRASSSGASTKKSSTPTLESLQNQICENCHVGVLQVIRYDPDALHEVGQKLEADNQHPSGGAWETQCGYCGQRLSHPFGSDSGAADGT